MMMKLIPVELLSLWLLLVLYGLQAFSYPASPFYNCDTDLDCREKSFCLWPGFGNLPGRLRKECFYCNCSMVDQCKLVCDLPYENMQYCDCAGSGFMGKYCDINIDDCNPDLCQNGGTCIDAINNYTCACADGFIGRHCENEITCDEAICVDLEVRTEQISGTDYIQCIESPGYPDVWYCDGLNFRWWISCPPGQRVYLKFDEFILEIFDPVTFTNGICTEQTCSGDIEEFRGNTDPTYDPQGEGFFSYQPNNAAKVALSYTSDSSDVTVQLRTDSCCDVGKGFSLSFKCVT